MINRGTRIKKWVIIRGNGNVQTLGGVGTPIERPQYLYEDQILSIINEGFYVSEYNPTLGIERKLDRLNYNKTDLFKEELKHIHTLPPVVLNDNISKKDSLDKGLTKETKSEIAKSDALNKAANDVSTVAKQVEIATIENKVSIEVPNVSSEVSNEISTSDSSNEPNSLDNVGMFLSQERDGKKKKFK